MKLNELRDNPGARQTSKVVGRGIGSGKGKTSGRGVKGQKSRTGVALKGFEGGQTPLIRRMPKKGFKNFASKKFAVINLDSIQEAVDSKKLSNSNPIDINAILEANMAKREGNGFRLLAGVGEFKAKCNFIVTAASAGAIKAVEAAGGKVEILPAKENKLLKEGKILKKSKRIEDAIVKTEAREEARK